MLVYDASGRYLCNSIDDDGSCNKMNEYESQGAAAGVVIIVVFLFLLLLHFLFIFCCCCLPPVVVIKCIVNIVY